LSWKCGGGTYEFLPTAYEIDMQMLCEVFPGVNNSYSKKRKEKKENRKNKEKDSNVGVSFFLLR